MKDRRKFSRKRTDLDVVIGHPALGQIIGHIRDMSEEGVFLDVKQSVRFKCGQIVGAKIIGDTGIGVLPLLSMEVVRVEISGIALKFVELSEDATRPLSADLYVDD